MIERKFSAKSVDVLLILEGTYPFIKGGVSTWTHQLVENMPELSFGIIFLGAYMGMYQEYGYVLPPNVVHLDVIYLYEEPLALSKKKPKPKIHDIKKIHEILQLSKTCPHALSEALPDIGASMDDPGGINYYDFLHSEEAWEFINQQFLDHSTDSSFVNYFWNIRNIHAPLWVLNEVLLDVPAAKLVHPVATGYSGLLATMLHQRFGMPILLSEHGLYTREREVELLRAFMSIKRDQLSTHNSVMPYQHQIWIQFFESIARTVYHYAFRITSLFQLARAHQLSCGAEESKLKIVPNGVDIDKFSLIKRDPESLIPQIVCYVGRFVRIKDIKTFVRGVAHIQKLDDTIDAWIKIVGEPDEDYLAECMEYIELLGLQHKIHFINGNDMVDILHQVGVIVLTSISEGMPLVVLEAMAAGVPVVTTDVGSCRELIEGKDSEDQQLGSCGVVVPRGDAAKFAEAVVHLLTNSGRWFDAQEVAIQRVQKYYSQSQMIETYRHLYHEAIEHGRDRD